MNDLDDTLFFDDVNEMSCFTCKFFKPYSSHPNGKPAVMYGVCGHLLRYGARVGFNHTCNEHAPAEWTGDKNA